MKFEKLQKHNLKNRKKLKKRQLMRNAENPRDTAVFDASGSQGHFFRKNKKKPFLDKV